MQRKKKIISLTAKIETGRTKRSDCDYLWLVELAWARTREQEEGVV